MVRRKVAFSHADAWVRIINLFNFRPRFMKNVLIFTVGFFGFLTGSYVSIGNIIKYFMGKEED